MRALVLALLLLFTGGALADTGGSMGGGNWGGGGSTSSGGSYSGGGGGYSSSSSGGGFSSSSSSTDWSSSSSSNSSSGSGEWTIGGVIGAFIMILLFFLVVFALDRNDKKSSFLPATRKPQSPSVDVSVLRVAIDGRARKFVQTELKKLAELTDTSTDWGRITMLHQVAFLLRRLRDAWVYGGALNYDMRQIGDAKYHFDHAVDDARTRYREEVIRNADGTTTAKQASSYTPRTEEGEGLILVSIIVAARKELFTVERLGDAEHLRQALDSLSQLPQEHLVAVEIVWQPADENDRMSSMELEVKYPHPAIAPFPHALVGKTFCSYCTGPFPAELVSCPHCGAPAPGREAA